MQEGMAVAIASPDKDFLQLLRPGIILLRPPKKPAPGERVNKYALVPYSEADFEAEYGLRPQQFVDVLALAGDASGAPLGAARPAPD
jgi:5'-3' exonuclease